MQISCATIMQADQCLCFPNVSFKISFKYLKPSFQAHRIHVGMCLAGLETLRTGFLLMRLY